MSYVKVFVMQIGEIDFNSLFYPEVKENSLFPVEVRQLVIKNLIFTSFMLIFLFIIYAFKYL